MLANFVEMENENKKKSISSSNFGETIQKQ